MSKGITAQQARENSEKVWDNDNAFENEFFERHLSSLEDNIEEASKHGSTNVIYPYISEKFYNYIKDVMVKREFRCTCRTKYDLYGDSTDITISW